MPMFQATVPVLIRSLGSLKSFLAEASESAEQRGFPADRFLSLRLAPDMFDLCRNVQTACDTAKFAPARLSGKSAPSHPDTETTMEELVARIEKTIEYLKTFNEEDFQGAASRQIELPFLPEGKCLLGDQYLNGFVLPNFYFHLTTTYSILRHNGVLLGKRKFIGELPLVDIG